MNYVLCIDTELSSFEKMKHPDLKGWIFYRETNVQLMLGDIYFIGDTCEHDDGYVGGYACFKVTKREYDSNKSTWTFELELTDDHDADPECFLRFLPKWASRWL